MDMLRYHTFTIGWAWKGDYGSSEDEANFKSLLSIPLCITSERMWTILLHWSNRWSWRPCCSCPFFQIYFNSTGEIQGPNPALIRIDVNAGLSEPQSWVSSKPIMRNKSKNKRYLLIPHVQFRHDNAVILLNNWFEKVGVGMIPSPRF